MRALAALNWHRDRLQLRLEAQGVRRQDRVDSDGTPTAGDWFRALGYTTHYFGKWHVSEPPNHTLQEYGFGDWELSWPEPHGASINNLGTYRDYQFADLACSFLRGRALPGVEVVDEHKAGGYPTPVTHASGRDPVFVGRIREDFSHPRGLNLWIVADNIRKGAALNAVQVAELVAKNG